MTMRTTRVRPVFLFALAAVLMVSCRDAVGPAGIARLALAPSFTSAAAGIVTIAQVRVRLYRADESLALDTTVTVPTGADSLALELTVTLNEPSEVFQMYLDFIAPPPARDTVFRAGPVAVTASSTTTEPVPVEVDAVYVGVGANAASVVITTPPGTKLLPGLPTAVTAEARDAGGQPIPGTPIAWASLDAARATVPDPAVGAIVGGTTPGPVSITATLLTGQADTVSLEAQPAPDLLVKLGGDGQTATAGSELPLPLVVQVLGTDLPIEGASVLFTTGDGGSFSVDSVVTDVNGGAQTLWTLGPSVGTQTATATVSGFASVTTTFTATAAAGVTVDWSNASGGSWDNPANWTPSRVPGAADTVVIALDGVYTVTVGTDVTVAALTVGGVTGLQTLALTGSTLTITGNATVGATGEIDLNGAGVSGAGVLTQNGVLRASGGTSTLNMATGNTNLLDVQSGTLEVQVGVTGTGSVSVASTASLTLLSGSGVTLAGTTTMDGALTVQAGAGLLFNGGTHTFGSSSSVIGAGDFDVVTGSVTVLGDYDLTGVTGVLGGTLSFENSTTPAVTSDLVVAGGALGGAGDLEVVASFVWTGGTMSGGSQLRIGSSATGDLSIGPMVLDGRNLVNNGSLMWLTGDIDVRNGAAITNGATGTFDVQAPDGSALTMTAGTATLSNDGTMTVASDGVVTVAPDLLNGINSTLDIQAGALAPTGVFTLADGAVLQGDGTLNLSGASVTALDGDVNPGTSPGVLTVTSALPLSALSAVNIELNGTTAGSEYDQLTVLGRATFGGVLNITAGFTPVVGNQFTVATFSGGRAGGFTAINGLDLGGGIVLDTVWTPTALTLEVPAPKIVFAGDSMGGLSTGIFTVNADSTGHVHVDTLIPIGYERQFPRWSPDRSRIAYSWDGGAFGTLQLFVTSKAAGGLPQRVVDDTSAYLPRWSPNGVHLAFECGNGFSIVDVCVIADVTGPIASLPLNTYAVVSKAAGIPPAWQGGQSGFAWDPQSADQLVFARDSTDVNDVSMFWIANYDGSGVQRLAPDGLKRPGDGADLVVYGSFDISPDGQQIVFAGYSPADAVREDRLFVFDRGTGSVRPLTFLPGYDDSPIFSPDGSEVLFGRDLGCDYDGWIVDITNTDGSLERAITNEHVCDFDTDLLGADWSPDGSEIVLTGFSLGNTLIYVVPSTVTAATYTTVRRLVGRGQGTGFVRDIQPSWRP